MNRERAYHIFGALLFSTLLLAGFLLTNGISEATGDCPDFKVVFEADEDSTIGGNLEGVGDDDDDDTFINEREVEAGDRVTIARGSDIDEDDLDVDDILKDGDGDLEIEQNPCLIDDGRLNIADVTAPAFVYRNEAGGLTVYTYSNATGGQFAFATTRAQVQAALDAATAPDGVNTHIAGPMDGSPGSVDLYALTSNECSMIAYGPRYSFVFPCFG